MAKATYLQLVERLENVFSDAVMNLEYNSPSERYMGICGWCGVMSPLTRPAYLREFGEVVLEGAEIEARERLEKKAAAFARTQYAAHMAAADAHGQAMPVEGCFLWMSPNWLKCEGGLPYAFDNYLFYGGPEKSPVLCRVDAVVHVSAEEFEYSPAIVEKMIAERGKCPGGQCSDDVPDDFNYLELSEEEKKTFYVVGLVVVDPAGRWYFIDSEGYNYSRYIFLPDSWREMYAPQVAALEAEAQRKAAEERAEMERQAAERRADYLERCAKWAPLMQDVEEAQKVLDATPYSDRKAYNAASRKLSAVRRANLSAMVRGAFPGLKFSVKKWDGWGGAYEISWTDGPTEKSFKAATDLKLFERSVDTFDGYDDSTDVVRAEFTEFSDKYLGCHGEIRISREISDAFREEIRARIVAAVPGIPTSGRVTDRDQIVAVFDLFPEVCTTYIAENLDRYGLREAVNYIARCIDATPAPEPTDPTGTDHPQASAEGGAYGKREKSPVSDALELVDYSDKAIALFGDSRAMVDELKAIGGRFNAKLTYNGERRAGWVFSKKKREAVAALIAPVEELPAPPAVVEYDPAQPVERAPMVAKDAEAQPYGEAEKSPVFERSAETEAMNARLTIDKVDDWFRDEDGELCFCKGYAFRVEGLGWLSTPGDDSLPYTPAGGADTLQKILDDGGFLNYVGCSWVNSAPRDYNTAATFQEVRDELRGKVEVGALTLHGAAAELCFRGWTGYVDEERASRMLSGEIVPMG